MVSQWSSSEMIVSVTVSRFLQEYPLNYSINEEEDAVDVEAAQDLIKALEESTGNCDQVNRLKQKVVKGCRTYIHQVYDNPG